MLLGELAGAPVTVWFLCRTLFRNETSMDIVQE